MTEDAGVEHATLGCHQHHVVGLHVTGRCAIGRVNPGRQLASRLRAVVLGTAAALCALSGTAGAVAPTASVTCSPASWSPQPVTCTVSGSDGAHHALIWTETQFDPPVPATRTDVYLARTDAAGANPVLLESTTDVPHIDADEDGRIYVGAGDTVTRYDESGNGTVLLADACGAGLGAGGAVTNIAATADGARGAVTCHDDSTGTDHLMFWDGGNLRELRQASAIWGVGQSIDISPDGSTIAIVGGNVAGCVRTCVYEASTLTGYVTLLADASSPDAEPQALAFVHAGRDIVFSDSDPADPPLELAAAGPPGSQTALTAAAGLHVIGGLDGTDALVADDGGTHAALDGDGSVSRTLPEPVSQSGGVPALQSAVLADNGETTTRYRVETSPGSGQFGDWTDIANGDTFTYATEGTSRIQAQAQNNSGTSATASTTASYDATAPSLQAGGLAYTQVVGEVGLFATVSDTGAGVGSVVFQYRRAGEDDWQTACVAANSFGTGYDCDWYVDGIANGTYEWRAQASDTVGNVSTSETGTAIVAQAPVPAANPTVTGTATEGQSLQASYGSWVSTEPLTYAVQWQRSTDGGLTWDDIADATEPAYTLTRDDVGAHVRVRVTASGQGVSAKADSIPTDTVAPLAPPVPPEPPPAPTVRITKAPRTTLQTTSTTVEYIESGAVTGTTCTLDGTRAPCTASEAALAGLSTGRHTFTVQVEGPGGTGSDTTTFAVTLPPPPPPQPTPAPTVTISAAPPTSTTGAETITYTETGDVTSTACTLNGAPVRCTAAAATFSQLATGTYVFTVSAIGPGGAGAAQARFTVSAARNRPPLARAAARRISARAKTQVFQLDARASYDPDGRIAAWRWFDDRRREVGRAALVTVRLRAGCTSRFRLVVTDNGHASSAVALRVVVPPAASGRR